MNGTGVSQKSTSSKMKQEIVDLTDNDDDEEAGDGQIGQNDTEDKYSYPLSQYDSDYEEDDDDDQNQNSSSTTNNNQQHPLCIKQEKEGKEIAKISNLVSLSNNNNSNNDLSSIGNSSSSSPRKKENGIANGNEQQQKQEEVEINSAGETEFVNQFTQYKCALCPLRFDTVEELNKHIHSNQHRAESMACCLVCARSVPSRLLQSHLKNHAGARKPHPCPHPNCALAFHRLEEWRNHILVHDFMADGSKPIQILPVATKPVTRNVSNAKRRMEIVDKNDPRIISTQLTINGKRNRVTPYSLIPSPSTTSSSSTSPVYSCPICRQQYHMKTHLELHIAQAHSNNMINSTTNTTTTNQGGRPVIFSTSQPKPQPRYALIINQPSGTNDIDDNSFQISDNNPVCPHCKAVFISEEYYKTHLDHCTMKGQASLLNGFGGAAQFVQLPPQVQKPRQVIFMPRNQNKNILGKNIINEARVGLSSPLPFGTTVYGSSSSQQQRKQQQNIKNQPTPQNQQLPFKMFDPPGRKIGILRKTISR